MKRNTPAGYLRVSDIARSPRDPNISTLLPITTSTWWAWVADKKAPQPIKLSAGCTVWRESEVLEFIRSKNRALSDASEPRRRGRPKPIRIRDVSTGIEYPSQNSLSKALGINYVQLKVGMGKGLYVPV